MTDLSFFVFKFLEHNCLFCVLVKHVENVDTIQQNYATKNITNKERKKICKVTQNRVTGKKKQARGNEQKVNSKKVTSNK